MKERDASMKKLPKNLHDALVYAVHEIDAYRIDYLVAEMDRCHCPANMVDGIAEHLSDLMNEYAADNDLQEKAFENLFESCKGLRSMESVFTEDMWTVYEVK